MSLLARYEGSTAGEFDWFVTGNAGNTTGRQELYVYDQTATKALQRGYSAAIPRNQVMMLGVSFDGGVAASGIKLWQFSGAVRGQVDNTTILDEIGFISIQDTTSFLRVGAIGSTASGHAIQERFAGGRAMSFITSSGVQLTANQWHQLAIGNGAYFGVNL